MSPKPPAIMQTAPWQDELTGRLQERFGGAISEFSTYLGQNFLIAQPESMVAIIEFLKTKKASTTWWMSLRSTTRPARSNSKSSTFSTAFRAISGFG